MKLQEFIQLRKRGLLLNERAMTPLAFDAHLKKEALVWFIEFPDNTWLREDRVNYTKDPCVALRFLSQKEALLFIEYYKLNEFGAEVTEHLFL